MCIEVAVGIPEQNPNQVLNDIYEYLVRLEPYIPPLSLMFI